MNIGLGCSHASIVGHRDFGDNAPPLATGLAVCRDCASVVYVPALRTPAPTPVPASLPTFAQQTDDFYRGADETAHGQSVDAAPVPASATPPTPNATDNINRVGRNCRFTDED